ncbi:glutaredoxin domain-containing protein [Corynebacterium felinum]|uniref:Glutaredoxin-related protein n=1 Tax=Corynebacterium felinum TaxID=131318 RepID=A0ABU2B7X4_9CORY|nr:glutaredoxin domain-containing protein [Corynebacterium felinum]MDF5820967.1 glutaredoxin domain-containing protein [Corynebacterium felinum]MDR7354712.1 glutaredoxin-related protein [Corynebacterium felinum]WJY94076.1 Glutaredoxin [Corynebacterium felinum]
MIVYGTPLCPDCVEATAALDARGIHYEYVIITESIVALKQFTRLRDTHPAFDAAKKDGYLGIPAFVREGKVSMDISDVLDSAL